MKRRSNRRLKNKLWFTLYGPLKSYIQCRWCPRLLTFNEATVDHIKERCLGGTSDLSNLTLACAKCNTTRSLLVSFYMEVLYKNMRRWRATIQYAKIRKELLGDVI